MEKSLKTSMLEYCKIILEKVRFNETLFRKEYRKAFKYLDPSEHNELTQWVRQIEMEKLTQ